MRAEFAELKNEQLRALILRSLVPPGTRRLEGWPHTNSHLWNLWARERKIRPHFNALVIGDNNSLSLRSHPPARYFQDDIYEKTDIYGNGFRGVICAMPHAQRRPGAPRSGEPGNLNHKSF